VKQGEIAKRRAKSRTAAVGPTRQEGAAAAGALAAHQWQGLLCSPEDARANS